MAEAVVHLPQTAHVEPLADHDDASPAARQLPVHVFQQALQGVAAFGEVHLQRHLALRVGQSG